MIALRPGGDPDTTVGSRDDGLSFEALRGYAASAKARVQASGATTVAVVEPNGPLVPVALFAAAVRIFRNTARLRRIGIVFGRIPVGRPLPDISYKIQDAPGIHSLGVGANLL